MSHPMGENILPRNNANTLQDTENIESRIDGHKINNDIPTSIISKQPEDNGESINNRVLEPIPETGAAHIPGDSERFEAVVEAILFASGEPLTLERIALIIERPVPEVKALLEKMGVNFQNSKRGLLLRELSGKYQLCTRPELSPYVNKLFEIRQKQSLSQAAYETLSIIAYNANVTRGIIEKIRGVNSDSSIARLIERELIMETGRANLPGRPMRYDVTDNFYRLFGFKSRSDLPDMGENMLNDSDAIASDAGEQP